MDTIRRKSIIFPQGDKKEMSKRQIIYATVQSLGFVFAAFFIPAVIIYTSAGV
jgi:hypothetical protein